MAIISITEETVSRKVRIYDTGIEVSVRTPFIGLNGGKRGKRGKVVGFSKHSANRLRKKLVEYDYAGAFAIALTAPDYTSRTPEDAFKDIARHLGRYGVDSMVWRKEVTARGRSHYHLVCWPSDGIFPAAAASNLVEAWVQSLFRGATVEGWLRCELSKGVEIGSGSLPDDLSREVARLDRRRDVLAEARNECRSVNMSDRNFRIIDSSLGYIRYLLDHTSKHKDYQAQTIGRAWGVLGTPPSCSVAGHLLSYEQMVVLLRCLSKMSRYRRLCGCVFGHKRCYGRRFANILGGGSRIQFGSDLGRLVYWIVHM